jgi:hypothetical protein
MSTYRKDIDKNGQYLPPAVTEDVATGVLHDLVSGKFMAEDGDFDLETVSAVFEHTVMFLLGTPLLHLLQKPLGTVP